MAETRQPVYTKVDNGVAMGLTFKRTNPIPLDNSLYFDTLSDAEKYAKEDPTAYVGCILTVKDRLYVMVNSSGLLLELTNEAQLERVVDTLRNELNSGIGQAGYQGDIAEMPNKLKKGMVFSTASDSITNIQKQYSNFPGTSYYEVGDWLIVKQDATVTAQTTTDDFLGIFGVWEKNLTGAVTTVTGGDAATGKYVSSVKKSSTDSSKIEVTLTDLPVKTVMLTGGGNVVTDVVTSGGVVNLKKSYLNTRNKFLHRSFSGLGSAANGYYPFDSIEVGKAKIKYNAFVAETYGESYSIDIYNRDFNETDFLVYLNGVLLVPTRDYAVNSSYVLVAPNGGETEIEADDVITLVFIAN